MTVRKIPGQTSEDRVRPATRSHQCFIVPLAERKPLSARLAFEAQCSQLPAGCYLMVRIGALGKRCLSVIVHTSEYKGWIHSEPG